MVVRLTDRQLANQLAENDVKLQTKQNVVVVVVIIIIIKTLLLLMFLSPVASKKINWKLHVAWAEFKILIFVPLSVSRMR